MQKLKNYLKSNRLTRPVYMVLYYLYWFGIEATLRKLKQTVLGNKKPANNLASSVQDVTIPSISHVNNKRGAKLYIEEYVDEINSYCNSDWFIDELPGTKVIEDGVILPLIISPTQNCTYAGGAGGVCRQDGTFVAGHIRSATHPNIPVHGNTDTDKAYPIPDDVKCIPETVVYGGIYIDAYGHMITESLSRLWWYAENSDCNYKCVFISSSKQIGEKFYEFIDLLGIPKENIVICEAATRFDNVIVPDQAFYFLKGYTEKAKVLFNAIRDSVQPGLYEKVYLTKTQFHGNDIVNEEYFENYYRNLGFEIISPEHLSLRDQISLLAGVKQLVCMLGTLGHQIVFCQDGINLTILKKVRYPIFTQYWLNQLRDAHCTFVDVSNNFMPHTPTGAGYLCVPTNHWKQYLTANKGLLTPYKEFDNREAVIKYIEMWAKNVAGFAHIPQQLHFMSRFSVADIVIGINEGLSDEKLDEDVKIALYEAFTNQK